MEVTRIEEISKSKVKVTLDHELTFCIYKGELRTYHIREQEELTQECFEQMWSVLERRAKLRCMNLLKSRDYTMYQLRTKLKDNGYPDEIAEHAIAYVASYGYVDDERYTRSYIESLASAKSRRQIETDLVRKGIDRQLITDIYRELTQELEADPEEELIRRQLARKHYNADEATYEEQQKVIAFLYRKGFQLDKIYKILNGKE